MAHNFYDMYRVCPTDERWWRWIGKREKAQEETMCSIPPRNGLTEGSKQSWKQIPLQRFIKDSMEIKEREREREAMNRSAP